MKKGSLVFIIGLLVLVSLSCTNPIQIYLGTQTALMDTATAAMWTPTYTATNTPTNTPTFTPTPDYIYKDDFEDSDSGWEENDLSFISTEYSDGGYRMLVKEEGIFAWTLLPDRDTYSNIRIEVDVMKLDGPDDSRFGLLCGYQDNSNYYGFLVTNDGYGIILKSEDGELSSISSAKGYEMVDGVNFDDWNHLTAVCNGEDLELYVNGEMVLSASDSSFGDGEVALVAGNSKGNVGADILFDNLYILNA